VQKDFCNKICHFRTNAPQQKSHHSITSSAMARRPGGKLRPNILAVLRLMTNSNLVDCSVVLVIRPTILDRSVLPLDVPRFPKASLECGHEVCSADRRRTTEVSNHRHRRPLLRPRREGPRDGRAAEGDELAALHSITSSAATSRPGGTVKPSAFAVLRLTVVSNLVAACTGRSAGLSPRRMRST
jgi:hypothetical protein